MTRTTTWPSLGARRTAQGAPDRAQVARMLLLVSGGIAYSITQHASVWRTVIPIIGAAPGSQRLLWIDGLSAAGWLMVALWFALGRVRGRLDGWLVALPLVLALIGRCYQFGLLTNPTFASGRSGAVKTAPAVASSTDASSPEGGASTGAQSGAPSSTVASHADRSAMVAFRLRLAQLPPESAGPNGTVELQRARDAVREEAARSATTAPPLTVRSALSTAPLLLAPLVLLLGFLAAQHGLLQAIRRWRRVVVLFGTLAIAAARLAATRGALHGFIGIEILLVPVGLALAASLAERVADIRSGGTDALKSGAGTLLALVLVALGFIPMGWIGGPRAAEFGVLSILCAATICAALVCVLRVRFLAAVVATAVVLVITAFSLSERPRERLANSWRPYPALSALSPAERATVVRRNDQVRGSDGAILDGGVWGAGAGRGLASLVTRAGDDTLFAGLAADLGLAGVTMLCLLYGAWLWRIGRLALSCERAYDRAAVAMMLGLIGAPAIMAWTAAVRATPLSGVSTPLLAMGGSKLLATAFSIGIIAFLSHQQVSRATPPPPPPRP